MQRMTRALVVLSALIILPLAAQKAYAGPVSTYFDISWSSTYGNGSGIFATTDEGGGTFLMTTIMGGGQAGDPIQLLAVNGYSGNDNLLFPFQTGMLDSGGFSFVNELTNIDYNIYYNGGVAYLECDSTGGTCFVGQGIKLNSFTVTPYPVAEPGGIAVLSSGLIGLFAFVRRKRLV
ncbi:MAG TPA: hypothetical protein VND65_22160 [Candidatus Binatia bacterium]|nr:hypothetical protein [Candidatus Binatia bacterium]